MAAITASKCSGSFSLLRLYVFVIYFFGRLPIPNIHTGNQVGINKQRRNNMLILHSRFEQRVFRIPENPEQFYVTPSF